MAFINIVEQINLKIDNLPWKKKYSKENARILFIDDDEFAIVNTLGKAGYTVEKINDVIDIDNESIRRAQIIFVDCRGVGKKLDKTEQGFAIIKGIKERYKKSKRAILYSAYPVDLGPHLNVWDNQIPKTASASDFIDMIEKELLKIK